ncbi:hypothetical protein [Desulfitobacterium sp. AusDCA]|uniref:hypothetical protein n=1 Tax=Desulfitobacterium sp. AusDCA TaxID=3240383 RepID=UPI003DA78016
MQKKSVIAALSLSLVVGLAGVVNAAPSAFMTAQPQASEVQAHMDNQDASSIKAKKETTAVNDQTAQEMTGIHKQMVESNSAMTKQMQNMSISTQQEMYRNSQMNNQMENMAPQTMQGQKSSGNSMMGSMNRMGR